MLAPQAGTNISATNVGERPKIIKNPSTGEYVMWFHSEDREFVSTREWKGRVADGIFVLAENYALANTGVAVSDTITGPYKFLSSFRPLGKESRDMSGEQTGSFGGR